MNPEHPVGGNKAKVFESALGYNKSNAEEFMQQIYENCRAVGRRWENWMNLDRDIQWIFQLQGQMEIL